MLISEIVQEPQPTRTLYHGTARGLIPSILKYGLEPQVGSLVRSAYDESDHGPLPAMVFAADKENSIHACVSGMGEAILKYYHLPYRQYDNVTLGRYGALCVIRGDVRDFKHRDPDDDYFDSDSHPQVERGDYFTHQAIFPDYILTGKKLVWWLEKQRARFEPWRREHNPPPRANAPRREEVPA